jgi:glutamate racemase
LARGADTLILGCTHYPFLASLNRDVVGNDIVLVDTGAAVARQLQRRVLNERPLRVEFNDAARNSSGTKTGAQFFTSDEPFQASRIISALWGERVNVELLPQEYL